MKKPANQGRHLTSRIALPPQRKASCSLRTHASHPPSIFPHPRPFLAAAGCRLLPTLLSLILIFGLPQFSSAERAFGSSPRWVIQDGAPSSTKLPPPPAILHCNSTAPVVYPRAQVDPRMDPTLVRASRIAEENAASRSLLLCWRYVKKALLEGGAVDAYPSTLYAKEAGEELTNRHGFVRLPILNPYLAPVGSVIVYGGHGAGHVELRTASGFVSDYHSSWHCPYPLIGIYAKLSPRT